MEAKYQIGQKFMTRGKHPKFAQVVDVLRTYNSAGELVKISYVTKHSFLGQIITDHDTYETTITMGLGR